MKSNRINDKLEGQIMKEFVGLRGKTFIKKKNDEDKKTKGKKSVKEKESLNLKIIKAI